MTTRYSLIASRVRLFAAIAFLLLSQQSALGQSFIAERQFSGFVPFDVEITPNATLAVARSANLSSGSGMGDSITVWETAGGIKRQVVPGAGVTSWGDGAPPTPSDVVAVTNDRAVVIGSGPVNSTQTTTYIDVLDIGVNPPVVIKHHVIATNAGDANDVAITRNGRFAVVNFKGGFRVLDLYGNGTTVAAGDIVLTRNLSGFDPGPAVDSVAVTNSRAVIVTGQPVSPNLLHTWVWILNLSTTTPSVMLDGHLMTSGMGNRFFDPHDVAITPDGSMAVVTSTYAVGLYNLLTATSVQAVADGWDRIYRNQVDSVEVSNDRAVVIGRTDQGQPIDAWVVDVYRLHASQGLISLRQWFGPTSNPPHDVAMSPDHGKAAVKTRSSNIIINNLASLTGPPSSLDLTVLTSNGDPNRDPGFPRSGTFVSDSVDLTGHFIVPVQPPDDGQRQFAVFIGAFQPVSPPGAPLAASIEVVNLVPVPALPLAALSVSNATFKTVPADLDLPGPLGPLTLRCNAPPDVLPGDPQWQRDYLQYGLDPVQQTANFGGRGFVFAMDSLVTAAAKAVSVGEDSNAPTYVVQDTFVHFVNTN